MSTGDQRDLFESLAETAEKIAETAARSADVHDELTTLPGAEEHATRDRRLSAAEHDAAAALRRHEVPSDATRQVVRESRPGDGPDPA